MIKILCLIEKPSPKSLGMVAVLTEDSKVSGLAPQSAFRSEDLNIQNVIENGFKLEGVEVEHTDGNAVALWVGQKFIKSTQALNIALPNINKKQFQIENAHLYIASSKEVYTYMDTWTQTAFDEFKLSNEIKQKEIANLMNWALPGDMRTLATNWKVSNEDQRKVNLQLFGNSLKKEVLEEKFKQLLEV